MRYTVLLLPVIFISFCCKKENGTTDPPPVPPIQQIWLKDIVVNNLPSPLYHFEYDTGGLITRASYASGSRNYEVAYQAGKIAAMKNATVANRHILEYVYGASGNVDWISYFDNDGAIYKRCFLTYTGKQLKKMEWELRVSAGFVAERTVTFTYRPDGNLMEFTSHRFPFEGHTEVLYTDHFEEYDTKINTDGFSIFHEDSEHLVLFSGMPFQKNNPRKLTRTGNGKNYTIHFTYTYNSKNAPLTKGGDAVFTNGPDAGKHFRVDAAFSYY